MSAPAKLEIAYETQTADVFDGKIVALFNPNQLQFTSSVTWERIEGTLSPKDPNAAINRFVAISGETLTVNLFFDTYAPYESGAAGGALGLVSGLALETESVTKYTDEVMKLGAFNTHLHRPPVSHIKWGEKIFFTGVLQRAVRTYTLFVENGTPVRATVDCTFNDAPGGATPAKEPESADLAKQYVVRPHDTLMGIAAALYGDGSLWRVIADANRLEDPRRLSPGRTLAIPKLR